MDYLKEISNYNLRKAMPQPEKTALLVIDMQRFFYDIAKPILKNVLSLIESCRAAGIKIIFTRHGHKDLAVDGGLLAMWWEKNLPICGAAEWELLDNIAAVSAGELIIDKNRYSCFYGTNLDELLRHHGINDLLITGVMTNCCCETTARDAFMRDYRVFFVADANATANDELQLASLKNLAFGFAYIVGAQELRTCLAQGG